MNITSAQELSFYSKIDKTSDCWLWLGTKLKGGYGSMSIGSRSSNTKSTALAHRISFFIQNGSIPYGAVIMHTCDNPSCVNPSHLIAGSQLDNIRDCISKGRKKVACHIGVNNPNSKITKTEALEIRGLSCRLVDIAEKYKISITHASRLRRGLNWNVS